MLVESLRSFDLHRLSGLALWVIGGCLRRRALSIELLDPKPPAEPRRWDQPDCSKASSVGQGPAEGIEQELGCGIECVEDDCPGNVHAGDDEDNDETECGLDDCSANAHAGDEEDKDENACGIDNWFGDAPMIETC